MNSLTGATTAGPRRRTACQRHPQHVQSGSLQLAHSGGMSLSPPHACDLAERAVFVHRLITARKFAGSGLGAELIDWAGLRG
jgi:hypothetical protein